jgi:hypothetical protein
VNATGKLRRDGTPRKFARFHCLRSPHISEPRAILCVGPYSTGMVFAQTVEEIDAAFEAVARKIKR